MAKTRFGRGNDTIIRDLGDGKKLSITKTPAGTRVNLHEGGTTHSVDPAAFAVSGISQSLVGGGHQRITVTTPDDQAVDYTRRGDGSLDVQVHTGGTSRKK